MDGYKLLVGILAVWRLTHLLHAEDGPWDVIVRVRRLAGSTFWGELLDCFYCLSLWVALPFGILLASDWLDRVLLWLALSAGAILLQRVTSPGAGVPVVYREHEEVEHELLRQETRERSDSSESDP